MATGARRLVGFSSKMYFSIEQTKAYIDYLVKNSSCLKPLLDSIDIFLVLDFLSLQAAAQSLQGSGILIGAQNCFYEDKGAYTGEISPQMLKDVGCNIVEIGHAERRRLFHESDDVVAKKGAAACRNGLIPLICIGEERRGVASLAIEECSTQVSTVLSNIPDEAEIFFAYEPIWAIGAASAASSEHVLEVIKGIRTLCKHRSGATRILYGGSAGPGLYEKLSDGVDGLFLGRFAHAPSQFIETIKEVAGA